ncbi:hypothetical protein [Psychroserpens sp. Hel_I_66]|uniref:hypothetical protein n=1 Tax=Psychroserpens sp. Hel_I_66 TaxID=1250004 RepID=UPI00068CC189|nr:hypothetical protein [Psychroserpens sp. Hel_I_66]
MNFVEKHKPLIITFLLSGTIVLALFSFSISKKAEFISESFYEIEPQTEEEIEQQKRLEELEAREQASNSNTNEAYNEDQEFKEMMRNFKTASNAPTDDLTEQEVEDMEDASQTNEDVLTSNSSYNASKQYALNAEDKQKFNKANDILKMHSSKKSEKNQRGNANSSVSFSLKDRQKVKLPPPVYLCETSGKIVVNITVNSQGQVTDTYINSSSSSNNQCLIDAAIEYAENAVFSNAERKSQIGSITYYFKGK